MEQQQLIPCGQCGKPATKVTQWQTEVMRAPAFWYGCDVCALEDAHYFEGQGPRVTYEQREITRAAVCA